MQARLYSYALRVYFLELGDVNSSAEESPFSTPANTYLVGGVLRGRATPNNG